MHETDPRHDVAALGDVVTVWAHPDDESYLAAGLMAMAVDLGNRVTCVTATAGERGGPLDQQAELSWLRPEELSVALDRLGVTDRVLLGCRDGGCADVDPDEAARTLAALLQVRRPDTVVTFGPDGLTGHPDHQAVSRWVDVALGMVDEPPRLLHATETRAQHAVLDGLGPLGATLQQTTTHDEHEIDLDLVLSGAVLDAKVAALRAHRSQTAEIEVQLGPEVYRRWVSRECFVDAPVPALAATAAR